MIRGHEEDALEFLCALSESRFYLLRAAITETVSHKTFVAWTQSPNATPRKIWSRFSRVYPQLLTEVLKQEVTVHLLIACILLRICEASMLPTLTLVS